MIAQLLTTDEVARILQVPVKTLYRWSYHGTGPPVVRVGRHNRYRSIDIEQWIDQAVKRRIDA